MLVSEGMYGNCDGMDICRLRDTELVVFMYFRGSCFSNPGDGEFSVT